MKVGDVVKVNESDWKEPGVIGIIIHDLNNAGRAFKVLLGNGRIRPYKQTKLELLSEN